MNAEQMAYKLYPYLCTNEYLTYCGDPFNKEACSNILGHFSFVSKNDENLHLSLPYTNSCSSLLSDPTDNNQLTTWAINAIWFLPQNIHYLYAEKGNRPLSQMATNDTCEQFAVYHTVRYHSNNFGQFACQSHVVMEVLYPILVHRQFTCYSPNDIISAALLIADTFNAALTHPQEWYSKGDKVLAPNKV